MIVIIMDKLEDNFCGVEDAGVYTALVVGSLLDPMFVGTDVHRVACIYFIEYSSYRSPNRKVMYAEIECLSNQNCSFFVYNLIASDE